MTYSRPNTRTVNAFADPGRPEQIQVRGQSRPVVSRAGEYIDERNPNQLIRNQEASQVAVNNFIETLTNQGSTIYKGALENQAKGQIAEVQKQFTNKELFAAAKTDEVRDVIRPLNTFAQDMLDELQADYGVNKYAEVYQTEVQLLNSLLTDNSVSDEEKSAALTSARQSSLEKSGLSGASPQVLSIVAPSLAQIDGRVSGDVYRETVKRQRENDLTKIRTGASAFFKNPQIAALPVEERRGALKKKMEAMLSDPTNYLFRPQDVMKEFLEGTQEAIAQLVATDNVDAAYAYSEDLLALSLMNIKTKNGIDLFGLEVSEKGDTGASLVADLSSRVKALQKKKEQEYGEERVAAWVAEITNAQGPAERTTALQGGIADIQRRVGPEFQVDAISRLISLSNQLNQPTEQQLENETMLGIETANDSPDVANDKYIASLQAGSITARQFQRLVKGAANNDPMEGVYADIRNARIFNDVETSARVNDLKDIAMGNLADGSPGALSGFDSKVVDEILNNALRQATETALAKKAKAALENGETWTAEDYKNEYLAEQERQFLELKKAYSKGAPPDKTQSEVVALEYKTFYDNLQKGPISVRSFAPQTIQRWRNQNNGKEPTVDDLIKSLNNILKPIKMPNGELAYPNITNDLRSAVRKNRIMNNNPGFLDSNNPLKTLLGIPQTSELEKIQGMERIPEFEDGSKTKEKPKSRYRSGVSDSGEPGPMEVVSQGLSFIGQVLAPPAKAGTLQEAIENADSLEELSRVISGQSPLSLKTQALPQVASASTVRRVPIAITNDKHSYFVAIGIAEGTRTPSGGYTKAYYGHRDPSGDNWNRGTVSGGRGATRGMSPQQVDRVWMGTLTRTASAMAPRLQALGLMPNTQGWNRLMFNILDLRVQAPAALRDATGFLNKIPKLIQQGLTVEAIAKARADSFYSPTTGRLDASGFGNNYSRLFADQRSRAGVFDYRSRL